MPNAHAYDHAHTAQTLNYLTTAHVVVRRRMGHLHVYKRLLPSHTIQYKSGYPRQWDVGAYNWDLVVMHR